MKVRNFLMLSVAALAVVAASVPAHAANMAYAYMSFFGFDFSSWF